MPGTEPHLPGLLPGPPLQPGELLWGGECAAAEATQQVDRRTKKALALI